MTFYLECDEQTRKKRMIYRGDPIDKIESRIRHDRAVFKPKNIAKVDYVIDSSKHSVEEVTDEIYRIYMGKFR